VYIARRSFVCIYPSVEALQLILVQGFTRASSERISKIRFHAFLLHYYQFGRSGTDPPQATKMSLLSKISSCRWDIAFLDESLHDVVSGKTLHFKEPANPYKNECWFADPFILDVTDKEIYVLVEEMPHDNKGRISKLTINRAKWEITNKEVILEEPWHLSFPFIIREGEKIYVAPESAYGKAWYLYELVTDSKGKDKLIRVKKLCDDVVWDSIIANYWDEPIMLTAAQDDFHLDIYKIDKENDLFVPSESIVSDKQNMRMAGDLFVVDNQIYCPSQNSKLGSYGEAVEIKTISHTTQGWELNTITKLYSPKGVLNDGIHTLNSYKGLVVVDIHRQANLLSLLIKKLVMLKKYILSKHS